MFKHSVKVPRHYKAAANIFKKVSTEGGSVKTLLYDNKLRHFRTNVLYALITETIKHSSDFDKLFENCSLLKNEPRLDPWLAKVLTAELLFGKKVLPGQSKPEQTILSYKEQFDKYTAEHQDELKTEVIRRPRYVRINTNLLTTSDAIRAFQDEGYRFIRCTSGSYDDYLKQIQGLTEYDFTQDYHVKTVFVFSSATKLHEHDLYLENKIILQDKATTLAVHLLAPPPGSVALDMCAAPGMKTTQLAAFMRNQGKIYAVEQNDKRYQTLCDFVKKTGSTCVQTIHRDALEIKRGGDYDDVEYILLDPSCSGSGMDLCVHNYIEDTRLAKLTSLQEKFLKRAMNSFPNAKRIVYSTCSLFPEENERVIANTVKTSRAKWRVQDVKELLKGNWNNFGSGMYGSMGVRCLYAKPDSDYTTGFFLAVLDRDQKDMEKNKNREEKNKNDKKLTEDDTSEKLLTVDTNGDFEELHTEFDVTENLSRKRKKEKSLKINNGETTVNVVEETDIKEGRKKKKKHKKYQDDIEMELFSEEVTPVETVKRKKKKDKTKCDVQSTDGEENEKNESQHEYPNVITTENVTKKKKNKRKNKEPNNASDVTLDTVMNSEQIPKKKNRKADYTDIENHELVEFETEGNVKKKKHKDKN